MRLSEEGILLKVGAPLVLVGALGLTACGSDEGNSSNSNQYIRPIDKVTPAVERDMFTAEQLCTEMFAQIAVTGLNGHSLTLTGNEFIPEILTESRHVTPALLCNGTNDGEPIEVYLNFAVYTQEEDKVLRQFGDNIVWKLPDGSLDDVALDSSPLCDIDDTTNVDDDSKIVGYQFPTDPDGSIKVTYGCHQ